MTTLYRPVLLTSAAQADALPRGLTAARIEEGRIAYTEDLDLLDDEDIGADDLYVLVPIEAEEETSCVALAEDDGPDLFKRRLVTPWEEA